MIKIVVRIVDYLWTEERGLGSYYKIKLLWGEKGGDGFGGEGRYQQRRICYYHPLSLPLIAISYKGEGNRGGTAGAFYGISELVHIEKSK